MIVPHIVVIFVNSCNYFLRLHSNYFFRIHFSRINLSPKECKFLRCLPYAVELLPGNLDQHFHTSSIEKSNTGLPAPNTVIPAHMAALAILSIFAFL